MPTWLRVLVCLDAVYIGTWLLVTGISRSHEGATVLDIQNHPFGLPLIGQLIMIPGAFVLARQAKRATRLRYLKLLGLQWLVVILPGAVLMLGWDPGSRLLLVWLPLALFFATLMFSPALFVSTAFIVYTTRSQSQRIDVEPAAVA